MAGQTTDSILHAGASVFRYICCKIGTTYQTGQLGRLGVCEGIALTKLAEMVIG